MSDSNDETTVDLETEVELLREVVREVTANFLPPEDGFTWGELDTRGTVSLTDAQSAVVARALHPARR